MNTAILQVVPLSKVCKVCNTTKDCEAFTKIKRGKFGVSTTCKSCRSEGRRKITADIHKQRDKILKLRTSKECSRCNVKKPLDQFAKCNWRKIGITSDCKKCRNSRYKDPRKNRKDKFPRMYGVTFEQVIQTLSNQNNLCANRGCGKEISLSVPMGPNRAVVDHDHKTGSFRGVLCMMCNLTLGRVEADQNKILGLMEYLTKHSNIKKVS